MAKSKFEYVKLFETVDKCLPNCWIVVRLDGKNFHKFSDVHQFDKPNDKRSIGLMTEAAKQVMKEFKDIILAYGQSDEYSFILRRNADLYNRRTDKIMTTICSLFSSSYVHHWSKYFSDYKMKYPPCFDARIVLYPTNDNLRDYLSWRQADCHINNLYNTTFWKLILKLGISNQEAENRLKGSTSSDKNEILFSELGINYNNEEEMFKKGTTLVRKPVSTNDKKTSKSKSSILELYCDIIGESFWTDNTFILT